MNDFIKEMYESYKGKFVWCSGELIYIGDPNDKEMYEEAVEKVNKWCNEMKQQIKQWEKQLKELKDNAYIR